MTVLKNYTESQVISLNPQGNESYGGANSINVILAKTKEDLSLKWSTSCLHLELIYKSTAPGTC